MHKTVVLIPTYNEADSILKLIQDLVKIGTDIVVIDDNSPDRTSKLVEDLKLARVRVINNGMKNGIGSAYIAGFKLVLKDDYDFIATMDADGSHLVQDLQKMLEVIRECDVVMGSRWIQGGSVTNWPIHRRLLSQFGTWYARKALKMDFKDLTGGLRVYRSQTLKRLNLNSISSNGYCFQIEMIRAFSELNAVIREMPIHFIERTQGKSKMNRGIVIEAFLRVSTWGIQRLINTNADKLHYVK
jgi:glycosyltransferase involved in cell wall biosynthesis